MPTVYKGCPWTEQGTIVSEEDIHQFIHAEFWMFGIAKIRGFKYTVTNRMQNCKGDHKQMSGKQFVYAKITIPVPCVKHMMVGAVSA